MHQPSLEQIPSSRLCRFDKFGQGAHIMSGERWTASSFYFLHLYCVRGSQSLWGQSMDVVRHVVLLEANDMNRTGCVCCIVCPELLSQ
jgi:hypothetical protein